MSGQTWCFIAVFLILFQQIWPSFCALAPSSASFIGQPSTSSSFMVVNSTTPLTTKISSALVKPQPSQTVISVYTGIVVTSSIEEGLTSQPLLMTSLPTKNILLVTSIQGSIASKLLPGSTWSPDIEKMKKLKNDFRSSTLSLIGQLSTTKSSFMVANSTYATRKMSSTAVKPQLSLSVTPVHTGIVITPSIEKSLDSQPQLTTSSPTKITLLVTSIQASTAKLLPRSTWSPDIEKVKLKNAHACFLPYPRWPQDFRWSSNGSLRNYHCVQIEEPSDSPAWTDNYFCSSRCKSNPGMRWSYASKILGMKCTRITKPAKSRGWNDNYLCLPSNSTLNFQWSSEGPIAGMSCIQWLEKSDPHSWSNSYLCGEDKNVPIQERNQTRCGQQEDFLYGQKVKKSIAKLNNTKLYGFCLSCTTNTTFKVEYSNNTLCWCDRIVNVGKPIFFECNKKLRLNFSVVISVRNISNQWGENCTFIFYFNDDGVTKTLPVTLLPATRKMSSIEIVTTPSTEKSSPSSTRSPDIEKMKKLKKDIDFINNLSTSTVKINDANEIDRILEAAANLINTNLTTGDQKEDPGKKAVEVLQDLGNSISQQLVLGNEKSVTFEKVFEDLVFGAAVINTTISPGFTFPSDDIKMTGGEKIDIPSSVFVSDKSYFVGIIFNAYRELRNDSGDLNVGTKVINANVSPSPNDELEDPVEMTFKKIIVGPTLAQNCSFWIENNTYSGEFGRWSTRQCIETFENESHIKCACLHLTNFAVLFKVSDEEQHVQEEHSFHLVLITYIGLGLSILGCLLTFMIYVALPNIKSERATIHQNLVFALGIADLIFLVTVAVKPRGDSCIAVAMLAFFFYLAVFFWMLVEGVYIYLMVIKVFRGNIRRKRKVAYIVGWGCPVLISLVTWVILRDDVVSKYHCWLSVQTGAIWAFVGPGLAIILTNCIILVAVMRITWVTFAEDQEYGGLKSATKTFGAVIPVLGITWIFGVMAFNDSSIVFQYIFAIVNSIQGALIFILYCIVNKEVRNEINRRITVWQTRREMSSPSATGGKRATHPYIISSEKNATYNRTTTSAQRAPDLYRCPLSEIKAVPPSEKAEERYSFTTFGVAFESDLELGVKENKDSSQETEGGKESGRNSPVELNKDSGDKDTCDDGTEHT